MKAIVFVGLVATALVGVQCENQITRTMRKYQVIPDVIFEGPENELDVGYGDVDVVAPHTLTPTETKDKPDYVNWDADDDAYYTLIFTAPDGPTRANPKFREVIKWLVVNIPGTQIDKGHEIVQYIGAAPEKKAGLSRYVYLVYKQKGKQEFDEKKIDNKSFEPRKHFSTRGFVKKHKLEEKPVAGTFFQSRWDDYVPVLYKQIGYKPSS
ncbi:protein D2-like [Episyrphus balteatus]|uniref:protein D2-like n=1 Tax=Episyrphus balteatus TaxID=286459 RepID=UPI00248532E4|nr:protein D2-like [Episyrphus balteatus]